MYLLMILHHLFKLYQKWEPC